MKKGFKFRYCVDGHFTDGRFYHRHYQSFERAYQEFLYLKNSRPDTFSCCMFEGDKLLYNYRLF